MGVCMSFVRRVGEWTFVVFASTILALSMVTTALAQVSGGDGDGADGDEFSALAIVLAVVAIGVVGWIASRRRSTRAH